jgi:hypothetical protein
MTDDDRRYDQLRSRLADQGRASAPPDLAAEVMRRVRAEPRGGERRLLRPAATLIAAALVVVAALAGIAHLGNGATGSSSSNGGKRAASSAVGGGGSSSAAPTTQGFDALRPVIVRHVASKNLGLIFDQARVPACPAGDRLTASVPRAQITQVEHQLRRAAAGAVSGADTRDVELHRAPKGQTRITITCP